MNNEIANKFFSKEENIELIQQVHSGLKFLETAGTFDRSQKFVINGLKKILYSMYSNSETYDELCQANINWIGNDFISSLRNYVDKNKSEKREIGAIFTKAYRFLCELEFSMPGEMNIDLRQIKNNIDEHLDSFTSNEKSQIIYANFVMPANIAKKIIHHENILNIKQFNSVISQAETKKEEWKKEIEKRKNEVKEISDTLKEYKNAFNFVGLYDGFKELSDNKNKEKFWIFISLIAIGILVVSPLVSEITYMLLNQKTLIEHKDTLIFLALPLVTIEIILIYFFRIILFNYKSVKALLVQIELRKTLCQFIQNYSDYSTNIKEKDATSLEKFENLIFSRLITNEDKLPSTFDGIEQLTKIIKSIK